MTIFATMPLKYNADGAQDREARRQSQMEIDAIIHAAQEIRQKYRDVPVAIKMSRETFRQLILTGNIKPSAEPISSLYGMPIIFDEEIPFGEVKEQFK